MKKTSLCAIFLFMFAAFTASALEFGDIREDTPLYVPGDASFDPFAIAVATNAYNKAKAETALRTAAITSATGTVTVAYLAAISGEATGRINGDSANNVAIGVANANIANVSNVVVSLSGSVTGGLALKLNITDWASSTGALWSAIALKVPTSRTITVNGATGSLSSNLVFTVSGGGSTTNYVDMAGAVIGVQSNTIANALQSVTLTNTTASAGVVSGSGSVFGIGTNVVASAVQTQQLYVATAGVVVGSQSNTIATAWQNPPSATNWTWTSDGKQITLVTYTGPNAVVIPDMLDGLPVTGFGTAFQSSGITSISLPNATTIGDGAFLYCTSLTSISLPNATTVGDNAFYSCTSLTSVSLPNATTVGGAAFNSCSSLTSVTFAQNAPAEALGVYGNITAGQVTNYVTNPTATGWGATWNGMPVVRMPIASETVNAGTVITIGALDVGGAINSTNLDARLLAKYDANNPSNFTSAASVTNIVANLQTASLSIPYKAWTGTITPANGTATVTYAVGNMPSLTLTAPAVLTLNPTSYETSGVSRVSLSLYCGTNSVTLSTNVITYATTPTLSTNKWNTILIRRVSNDSWKGVQL